jgi:NTE family protein
MEVESQLWRQIALSGARQDEAPPKSIWPVAEAGDTEGAQWAGMRIHRVSSEARVDLGYSSKLNAEWEFLTMLRDGGRRSAEALLSAHAADLGRRSSLDLDVLLQGV